MGAKRSRWNSSSVAKLARDADPISEIESRARALVLKAMDMGWSGPPFDPIKLASLLGFQISATDEVRDARLTSTKNGPLIEFNPNRPHSRVKFSVAHEIAHTFFPDYSQKIRHRSADHGHADDHEVEMLCNIGAAEILMPLGSFLSVPDAPPDINDLMDLRAELGVSTEALLLRFAHLSRLPVAMFCASKSNSGRYVVDYMVGSEFWSGPNLKGMVVAHDSCLTECTAIGFTAKANESWGRAGSVHVEAVGLPAFPGSIWPRVAGLLISGVSRENVAEIEYVHGDATQPRGDGPRVVCQVVNNAALRWAPRGFAAAAKRVWPDAQASFTNWITNTSKRDRLGAAHIWKGEPVSLASLVAQEGWGNSTSPRIKYSALASALGEVARYAGEHGASVHMYKIGTGQAGGKWEVIEEMVRDQLVAHGVKTTVYSLPS